MRAGNRPQTGHQILAHAGGVLDHAFLDQHAQGGAGDRARQRIAAEGAAVITRLENPQHRLFGKRRRNRMAAVGKIYSSIYLFQNLDIIDENKKTLQIICMNVVDQ
jgi:hypothetical protein